MKKIFILLVFSVCGLLVSGQVVYQEKIVCHKVGSLYFRVTSDSTAELSPMQCIGQHCDTYPLNTVVPSNVIIDGHVYVVNRIGDEAFLGEQLRSLSLPPTIREIGREAFRDCTTPVTLPESVSRIEYGAFANYKPLIEEFHIPRNVEQIDETAFYGMDVYRFVVDSGNNHYVAVDSVALCNRDTTLLLAYAGHEYARLYTVPFTVRRIASGAFSGNLFLRAVTLPEELREIGDRAFFGSRRLETLHIPASVCLIEGALRDTASSRFNFTVDSANRRYKMENNSLMSYDGDTLLMVLGAEGEYTVPANVRVLGDWIFFNNTNLSRVNLPTGVEAIGKGAFAYSTAEVWLPTSLQSIGEQAFNYNAGTRRIAIPNVTHMGRSAFEWSAIEIVDSTVSLRTIPPKAFRACPLTTFMWGDRIEAVEDHAFDGTPLTGSMTLPASLRRIGAVAFYTYQTKEVSFSGPVDTIGEEAFRCRSLHFCDTKPPVTYVWSLDYVDTVYAPCGYAGIYERSIEHGDNVIFEDWCPETGIDDVENLSDIVLYPNPAQGAFYIKGLPSGVTELCVADLAGRIVLRQTLHGACGRIDTANLPLGIYLVTIRTSDVASTLRLVIE